MRAALLVTLVVACGSPPRPVDPQPTPPDAGPPDAPPPEPGAPDPEPPSLVLVDPVTPTAYDLRLDLDSTKEAYAGTVAISVRADGADHVWLHASGLDVTSATLSPPGEPLHAIDLRKLTTSRDDLLGLDLQDGTTGDYVITLAFTGHAAEKEVQGLFRQQDGQRWYLYSQFEAISARRAFPCFDEPRFKVPWTVTLVTPRDQAAYANAPVSEVEHLDDGRDAHHFKPTPPIPSYLVAVAAGPFEVVDVGPVGRDQLPARILVPAGRKAEAATAAKEIPRVVASLETYFDMALPFDKVDSIVIPHFFGAMENPGLVTYDSGILLAAADRDDTRFRHRMMSIVGHELAHQWFGDYVTMAWWDDIWLNESFATWMADKVMADLEPDWDADARRIETSNRAMGADGQLASQPLRRNVATTSAIEGGFDAIAYDKGGAVLTMFEGWIGVEAFRTGVRTYMKAHARGNASAADFIAALAGASTPETGEAFRAYLEQPGVPLVRASLTCGKHGPPRLVLHQERLVGFGEQAPADLWPIQVCARFGGKKGKSSEVCGRLDGADGELELTAAETCPAWLDANARAAGYYRVAYTPALRTSLQKHLKQVPTLERMAFAADQAALLDAGQLGAAEALELVAPLLATGDGHDLASAVALIGGTAGLVAESDLPAWRAWVIGKLGKRAAKAPLDPPKGESGPARDARLALLELVGSDARDRRLGARARKAVDPWLTGKDEHAPAELDTLLVIAARAGGDAALFDAILARARAATDQGEQMALLEALGGFIDDELIAKAVGLVATQEFDIYSTGAILQRQLETPEGAVAVAEFVRGGWELLVGQLPKLAVPYLVYMQSAVCDQAGRDALDAFVGPRVDQVPDGAQVLAMALSTVDRCIARRAALGADLATIIKP